MLDLDTKMMQGYMVLWILLISLDQINSGIESLSATLAAPSPECCNDAVRKFKSKGTIGSLH